jgi:hypothetical protein
MFGGPAFCLEAGCTAWLWSGGDVHLVRVVRLAPVAEAACRHVPGAAVVMSGRVFLVPADRLTALPEADTGPHHA